MKRTVLLAVPLLLLTLGFTSPGAAESEDLQEAIDHLVEFVRTSDVVFIRNEKEHTPEDAAAHMLKKYKYAKRKVKTPEDFIEYCATKSTMSGKLYRVRLEDGTTVTSAEWLLAELEAYREKGAGSAAGEIVFEMMEFERRYGPCPTRREDCASITIRYPAFSGTESSDALARILGGIERHLLGPVYENTQPGSYDELADSFISAYKMTQKDIPDYSQGWTLDREASVVFASSAVICIAFTEVSYTGGAHPNSSKKFANFDASTGMKIGLGDILKDGYGNDLAAAAEARFREARGIEPGESLNEDGFWFADDAFVLNDNFGITGQGLVFHFEPYEIAPYAMGPTEFTIPYSDISSLIDAAGPLKGVLQ